jgi:ubiquinone/menaquinone biosynthesis C-methylase UbiE
MPPIATAAWFHERVRSHSLARKEPAGVRHGHSSEARGMQESGMRASDKVFVGSIPAIYDRYMGPLLFAPYAADLAQRVSDIRTGKVLETASGTGIVTRALASALPKEVTIVASDLNQPMLDFAAGQGGVERVAWRQADASALPFDDAQFDAVVCQFGVMFFPDKQAAFREARRVLKPGGRFVFNVWDRIEDNEFADVITRALAEFFPQDPPRFFARTPHGYHDLAIIRDDLQAAGFAKIAAETLAKRSRADSHRDPAIAICQGTPLRSEIEARDKSRLDEATDFAASAVAARFGNGPVDAKMQAHVITAVR